MGAEREKDENGRAKGNSNAKFAITLKSKEYVDHLWTNIFKSICTDTAPHPWPNPKSGKPITQYHFSSRALPSLSLIHDQWYKFNEETKSYKKIVPLNIEELITPIGLSHWIMDDGYRDKKTVVLCTDSFTLLEVNNLLNALKIKFDLQASLKRRIKSNKEICWRIRFSGKDQNINKLRSLLKPYFLTSMLYKLSINNDIT